MPVVIACAGCGLRFTASPSNAAGRRYCCRACKSLAHQAAVATSEPYAARTLAGLTPRQRAYAELVAAGLMRKEMAARLGVTGHTVKNVLTEIYRRTGCQGRMALARWVWEQERGEREGVKP